MASVLDLVKHYQHAIEKYPEDETRLLKSLDKLFSLDVTVAHLQDTGVGRTVNALRKEPGLVGKAARSLVYKWKQMVAAEDSDQDDEQNNCDKSQHNGPGKEPEYNENRNQSKYQNDDKYNSDSLKSHEQINGDHRRKRASESSEEEPDAKRPKHFTSSRNEEYNASNVKIKEEDDVADSRTDSSDNYTESEMSESSKEEKPMMTMIKVEPPDDDKKSSRSKHSSSDKSNKSKNESMSTKISHDSLRNNEAKTYRSESKISDGSSSKKSKSHSSNKHESSHEKERKSENKHKSTHKSGEKERHRDSEHSDNKQKSSSKKHESRSDKSKSNSQSSKHKSDKDKPKKSDQKSTSHRTENDKHKTSCEKEISKEKHKSKHSSSSEKHTSSKTEKTKELEKSSDKHKKDKHSSGESATTSKSQESKLETGELENKKSKPKSSTSSSDKRNKSTSDVKESKQKHKIINSDESEEGIDSGSGASFAEALGMLIPSKPKKKSKEVKSVASPNSTLPMSSSISNDLSPASLLAPTAKLTPLPAIAISALPEISPNYKPMPPPKPIPHFTDGEDALNHVLSSKNQRTKVYSGNKTVGKMRTLFDSCVQVLRQHIDAIEYTGGVPYDILKPVIDSASAQQLFTLEHYNPYLMEDTDHLWKNFCERHFRNQKRQELESWREMFIRCQEEQENRLRNLTANIRSAQEAKKAPIKTTKMAYVDTVVKPPRNIAKKQAQHGTAHAAAASPAARVSALANNPNILRGGVRPSVSIPSISTVSRPKKAPLMQKALQLLRGRKR